VAARPDSGPEPILEVDDVMRDALADIMQSETQYSPVVDAQGRIAGVLSIEIIQDFLASPQAKVEEHPAAERPLAHEETVSSPTVAGERPRDYPPGD
jgi:hypothetical protein